MRAIVQTRYGPPEDVLELREVDRPVPGDGEVLVRVRGSSMHPDIWHTVTGRPHVLRLMGAGLVRPKVSIPGTEVAGQVEALGPHASRVGVGDAVYGEIAQRNQWSNAGGYAEYAAVHEDQLEPMPSTVSFEQAAAVPTSAAIALRALVVEGRLTAGQRVAINGAGGGVGTFAVQIAKAYGAEVTAVDRGEKLEMLRTIGADHVIDHMVDDLGAGGEPFDLVLDVASTLTLAEVKHIVEPDGAYVLIGHDHYGAAAGRWLGSLGRFLRLLVVSPFVRQVPGVRSFGELERPLLTLSEMIEDGRITPVVDRTFGLDGVLDALRRLQSGHALGKIVITP